jgi:integrase/recombinase XerD
MTLAIVLDKKKMTTTGENAGRYHVKIRLTYTRDQKTTQKYFMTKVYATESEFKKIIGNPGKDRELQEKQTRVNEFYEKGKAILKANPFIDADTFGSQLTAQGSYKDPLGFMLAYAEEMESEGRIGTRDYYLQAHSSFKKFTGGVMSFATVTAKWLMRYEKWMLDNGRSITTVGMYCIALRTIFNMARSDKRKIIPKDLYPFGKDGYVIPTSKGRKLALSEDDKNLLINYEPKKDKPLIAEKRWAVDLWLFSYFCSGMNFADMAALKYKHIKDGVLVFDRAKTKLTQRNKESTVVVLRLEVMKIIARHGNKENALNPNAYIFNVLRDGLTPRQVADKVHDFIADVNEYLGEACEELKIPKITTYWARHTFATIAKRKGASIEAIQEALGHSSSKTTQAYLDSFDLETKRQIANML